MSRTTRRKQGIGWCYGPKLISDILEVHSYEWVIWPGDDKYLHLDRETIHIDPKSKEGKKRIAKFHSDASYLYNRFGPNWYVRLHTQRPYRRFAKRELQKAMVDDEYEAIIPDKPKRSYWD